MYKEEEAFMTLGSYVTNRITQVKSLTVTSSLVIFILNLLVQSTSFNLTLLRFAQVLSSLKLLVNFKLGAGEKHGI